MAAAVLSSAATYAVCTTDAKPLSAFANLFGDIDGDGDVNAGDAAEILMYAAWKGAGNSGDLAYYLSNRSGDVTPTEPPVETPSETPTETPSGITLTNEDKVLSIVCWTDADLANMLDVYTPADPNVKVRYVNCGCSAGGDAAEKYMTFLNSGSDADLYFAEGAWLKNYIDNDSYSLPLSELGITATDYADAYDYTVQIGTDSQGVLKAASWQTAAGCYAYNATLAKEYLGVTSPEEMQAKISDWDKFEATAAELKTASDGRVKIAATLGGLWQAYSAANENIWVKDNTLQYDIPRAFSNMAKRYVENGYVDPSVQQWTSDWTDIGLNEKALGYFYASWCLGEGAQLEQHGGDAGNWRICRGPQDFFWGGSWICVSPNCDTKAEAANFLRAFTVNTDSMEEYALYSGDMVNNKTAMNRIVANGSNSNALLGGQDQFAVLKEVADGARVSTQSTKYDAGLRNAFIASLEYTIYDSTYDTLKEYQKQALYDYPQLSEGTLTEQAGDAGATDNPSAPADSVWMAGLPTSFAYFYGYKSGDSLFNNIYETINLRSVSENGSFRGDFRISDYDEEGVGYTGTHHYNYYSGSFGKAEKIDDYTYRTSIASVTYEKVGESSIASSWRTIYDELPAFENPGDIYIYLPGKPVSSIPAAFMKTDSAKALADYSTMPEGTYGIYFESTQQGLIGIK